MIEINSVSFMNSIENKINNLDHNPVHKQYFKTGRIAISCIFWVGKPVELFLVFAFLFYLTVYSRWVGLLWIKNIDSARVPPFRRWFGFKEIQGMTRKMMPLSESYSSQQENTVLYLNLMRWDWKSKNIILYLEFRHVVVIR